MTLSSSDVLKWGPNQIAVALAEAEGWMPNEGDTIEGICLGIRVATNKLNNTPYPIVILAVNDSEMSTGYKFVAIHCFASILRNEMISQRPEKGDLVYVADLGEKKNWTGAAGMNPPIVFAVAVTKPTGEPADVWSTFAAPTANAQAATAGTFKPDEPPF